MFDRNFVPPKCAMRSMRRFCSTPSVTLKISADRLVAIIAGSHASPVGRITDDFDKTMKELFAQKETQTLLANSLLTDVGETRFRIPSKMREYMLSSVADSFESLTAGQVMSIPVFLRKLPKTLMSSAAEEKVFELLLSHVWTHNLAESQFEKLLVNISRLHFKNPCKDTPIVRFFEAVRQSLPVASKVNLLTAAAAVMSRAQLTHPVIRAACIRTLTSLPVVETGNILFLATKLPVFPQAKNFLEGIYSQHVPLTTPQSVKALVGLASAAEVNADFVSRIVKSCPDIDSQVKVLRHLARCGRINRVVASEISGWTTDRAWDNESVAGWCKVLKSAGRTDALPTTLHNFKSSRESIREAVTVAETVCEDLSGEELTGFFKSAIEPCMHLLSPKDAKRLLKTGNEALIRRTLKALDQVGRPETVAAVLVGKDSEQVAARLRTLLTGSDLETLVRVEKILTQGGLIYADPSVMTSSYRGRVIKEVTAQIFRSVRMAPVPKIVKH